MFIVYLLDQSASFDNLSVSKPDTRVSNYQIGVNSIFTTSANTVDPLKTFLYVLFDATLTRLRTNTFSNWPVITPNAQDMSSAGFYYTNIADRVICPHCDAVYHKWKETDRPYDIHKLKSPQCPFIIANEKKGTPLAQTTPITITSQPNTQLTVDASNSPYALACRRQETFQNWPAATKDSLPSVDSFIAAGFYYTGIILHSK